MINLEKGLKRMKIEMDMCCCSECETTFKVSDCELDHEIGRASCRERV